MGLTRKTPAIDPAETYIAVESFVIDGDFRPVTTGARITDREIIERRLPEQWFVLEREARDDADGEDAAVARRRYAIRAEAEA
jgi:hypothetical protein